MENFLYVVVIYGGLLAAVGYTAQLVLHIAEGVTGKNF